MIPMAYKAHVRKVLASAHVQLCLRWPTLLAIAMTRFRRRKTAGPVRSILLVRPDGLGDCVLTLPLVRALRRCYPTAQISVLTTPMAASIFVSSGAADRVLILRPALTAGMPKFLRGLLGALRAWWQHLRGRHYDWAILPRWDADIYHGTLLCVLSGAAASVGYADDTAPDKLAFCRGFQRA